LRELDDGDVAHGEVHVVQIEAVVLVHFLLFRRLFVLVVRVHVGAGGVVVAVGGAGRGSAAATPPAAASATATARG